MNEILEHLGKDTLPDKLLQDFVAWCVWEQARPALVNIFNEAGLKPYAAELKQIQDYGTLALICGQAGQRAHESRKANPVGVSAAEAAAFLANKMARAAEEDFDPEAVAFFSTQVCGWQGYAHSKFKDAQQKQASEKAARQGQAAYLYTLWEQYSASA